jgi:D-glycero-D-manno-heptose 1,7-bisphosphate phosphatase
VSRRAVFLDRDGVINRAPVRDGLPCSPGKLEALELLPQVGAALGALRLHGYALIIVTNQPDVARGRSTRTAIEQMHARLRHRLPLDAILTCYHDHADACDCRKPRAGLLLRAAAELAIDLSASFMIGDRWRDIDAGRSAGCRTFFVDYGYREPQPAHFDYRVRSLPEAAAIILGRAHATCPA